MIKMIFAMDKNGIFASGTRTPWHFPLDLHRFSTLTRGGSLIMGRNTWNAPDMRNPLPYRTSFVVTSSMSVLGGRTCRSLEEAVEQAKKVSQEIWLVGGAEIWREGSFLAHEAFATLVEGSFAGDKTFPKNADSRFVLIQKDTVWDVDSFSGRRERLLFCVFRRSVNSKFSDWPTHLKKQANASL